MQYAKHNQVLAKQNCEISCLECSVQVARDHVLSCDRSSLTCTCMHFEQICSYFAVGTCIDLQNLRKIPKEEGEKFALENDFDLFFETSAVTGENVHTVSS